MVFTQRNGRPLFHWVYLWEAAINYPEEGIATW